MDGAASNPLSETSLVAQSLVRWPLVVDGVATLINLSENHTFRIDGPGEARHILRLHRPRYHSPATIGSELAWLAALGAETDIPVPRALAGSDGEVLQELAPDRYAALFSFETGSEAQPDDDLPRLFAVLGRYAATAHTHAASWQQPERFVRPIWDAVGLLEPAGLWGDWRKAPHVEGTVFEDLQRLENRLRADLRAYGTDIDRFGLIHADMRLANLLVEGERVTVLDFDDCGFGWFLYDLAASLSFLETSPLVPALIRSWLTAYMEIRPLTADDIGMIDAMILLRRMALLAWIGSHAETDLAKAHQERFAADTADLARRYLARQE